MTSPRQGLPEGQVLLLVKGGRVPAVGAAVVLSGQTVMCVYIYIYIYIHIYIYIYCYLCIYQDYNFANYNFRRTLDCLEENLEGRVKLMGLLLKSKGCVTSRTMIIIAKMVIVMSTTLVVLSLLPLSLLLLLPSLSLSLCIMIVIVIIDITNNANTNTNIYHYKYNMYNTNNTNTTNNTNKSGP